MTATLLVAKTEGKPTNRVAAVVVVARGLSFAARAEAGSWLHRSGVHNGMRIRRVRSEDR